MGAMPDTPGAGPDGAGGLQPDKARADRRRRRAALTGDDSSRCPSEFQCRGEAAEADHRPLERRGGLPLPAVALFDQSYLLGSGGLGERGVERRQRHALALRQLQIGGVVDAQPIFPGEPQKRFLPGLVIEADR